MAAWAMTSSDAQSVGRRYQKTSGVRSLPIPMLTVIWSSERSVIRIAKTRGPTDDHETSSDEFIDREAVVEFGPLGGRLHDEIRAGTVVGRVLSFIGAVWPGVGCRLVLPGIGLFVTAVDHLEPVV